MNRAVTVRLRTEVYRDALAIIAADYPHDLQLDEVARRVASSRRQLQRCFREIGQTTFREQLATIRMQRAAEMLALGSLHVRTVANKVGYSQPAQFAKVFRRHHGVAPAHYRAQQRLAAATRGDV